MPASPQNGRSCPTESVADASLRSAREAVQSVLQDIVLPILNNTPPCGCDQRRRIAFLNMEDRNQRCPTGWKYITTPVRACGRATSSSGGCNSTTYSSSGVPYSRVCGRITGYQQGSPNAFNSFVTGSVTLDGPYIDGVSLTYRNSGFRRMHIWSFVNAYYEAGSNQNYVCSCSNPSNWPHQVPSFIRNDYFCASGNRGSGGSGSAIYSSDPLWDGQRCGSRSTCCKFNNPPWFCKMLPQPTTSALEVRVCGDQETSNENTYISQMEIYVQ